MHFVPQHKSAKKRVRRNDKKKLVNNAVLSRFKSSVKSFKESINKNDPKLSQELLSRANSLSAKAVKKGIIKSSTASRIISDLARMLKS